MYMPYLKAFFPALILLLGISSHAGAQENNSLYNRVSIDLNYGMPTYYGDFYKRSGEVQPYQGFQELEGTTQYNTQSIGGSLTVPLNYILALRLHLSQSVIYFAEENAQVLFKNHLFNMSLTPQVYFVNRDIGAYAYAGPGINLHSDPNTDDPSNLPANQDDLGSKVYNSNNRSISLTGGLGVQYHVFDWITVFAEGQLTFTGSDRIDGYNGPSLEEDNPADPKPYFKRDRILTYKGGLRFRLLQPAKPVAERPENNMISSYVPDPNATDEDLLKDAQKDTADEESQLTERMKNMGVKTKLSGYTLKINHVMDLDQLERQKQVARRVAGSLSADGTELEVFLLKEAYGFSLHFGYFDSYEEAKAMKRRVEHYYAGAQVQRN